MSELREWMKKEIGGLQDARSTESYALEFMQTERVSLKRHQDATLNLIRSNDSLRKENAMLKARIESLEEYIADLAKKPRSS